MDTNNWIASRSCRTLFVPYHVPLVIYPSPLAVARLVSNHFREEDASDPVAARYGRVLQAAICPALSVYGEFAKR